MRPKPSNAQCGVQVFNAFELLWALGSLCVLHQRNFSSNMLSREFFPEPSQPDNYYTESTLLRAANRLGFRAKRISLHVFHQRKTRCAGQYLRAHREACRQANATP